MALLCVGGLGEMKNKQGRGREGRRGSWETSGRKGKGMKEELQGRKKTESKDKEDENHDDEGEKKY